MYSEASSKNPEGKVTFGELSLEAACNNAIISVYWEGYGAGN
jgi:hypothetical protein